MLHDQHVAGLLQLVHGLCVLSLKLQQPTLVICLWSELSRQITIPAFPIAAVSVHRAQVRPDGVMWVPW